MVLNSKKILLFVVVLEKDLILFLSKCLHVLSNLTNQTDLGVFSLCFFIVIAKLEHVTVFFKIHEILKN